jgi:hypothetical protein
VRSRLVKVVESPPCEYSSKSTCVSLKAGLEGERERVRKAGWRGGAGFVASTKLSSGEDIKSDGLGRLLLVMSNRYSSFSLTGHLRPSNQVLRDLWPSSQHIGGRPLHRQILPRGFAGRPILRGMLRNAFNFINFCNYLFK